MTTCLKGKNLNKIFMSRENVSLKRATFRKHCRGAAVAVEREITWKSYI